MQIQQKNPANFSFFQHIYNVFIFNGIILAIAAVTTIVEFFIVPGLIYFFRAFDSESYGQHLGWFGVLILRFWYLIWGGTAIYLAYVALQTPYMRSITLW